jgi:DNA-binding MarR family transcriptional regulator
VTERVDVESRTGTDDHLSLRLWLRLLSVTNLVEGNARAGLRREFSTTLARFDLLAQLERCPEGLPMSALSRRLMVTGGNVTRLTDQLEAEKLVLREASNADRRVFTVKLTPAGRRAFAAMAVRHEPWIVDMFGALSQKERTQMYALLAKLKRHIGAETRR